MTNTHRGAVAAWLAAGLLLLSWSGVAAISEAKAKDNYGDAKAQAGKVAQFYLIVAGELDGQGGVLNKLARDLRDLETTTDVYEFTGDANRYGGITGELGFDPFAGVNCDECGPLESTVAANVVAAKGGGVQGVIEGLQPPEPKDYSGAPLPLWLLWGISLPGGLLLFMWWAKRKDRRLEREMPDEMRLVREINEALEQTFDNPHDRYELVEMRGKLLEAINERVRYGEQEARNIKLRELREEIGDSLSAIEEGNKALQ
jgi:hypothetical protein